jgi:hypothetical protein
MKLRLPIIAAVVLGASSVAWADPLPYGQGENLDYVIRWGAITGGYSQLAIQGVDLIGAHPVYHIVSQAHSTGLVDKFYRVNDRNESWISMDTPYSLRYQKQIQEGKYRVQEVVDLDQDTHQFHEHEDRLDKNSHDQKDGPIPPNVLDILGSLYYVRTLPLAVGASYTIDVHSGDKTWPLMVKVLKRERIKVKAGKFDCFKVQPLLREPGVFVSKGKKLEVWLTADARRIPVLMRSEIFIGHVSAELVRKDLPPLAQELAGQLSNPSASF